MLISKKISLSYIELTEYFPLKITKHLVLSRGIHVALMGEQKVLLFFQKKAAVVRLRRYQKPV